MYTIENTGQKKEDIGKKITLDRNNLDTLQNKLLDKHARNKQIER